MQAQRGWAPGAAAASPAHASRRRPGLRRTWGRMGLQRRAAAAKADSNDGGSVAAVIAEVLNAQRAASQPDGGLLARLDELGLGLETTVARTWDNRVATLQLEGTWRRSSEARRMAMLAVYQEHMVERARAVAALLQWVDAQAPGLMDPRHMDEVKAAAGTNAVNPAVAALPVPGLVQLAAAGHTLPALLAVLERARAAASAALASQLPSGRASSAAQAQEVDLAAAFAQVARGAAYARLRYMLLRRWRQAGGEAGADAPAWQRALQQGWAPQLAGPSSPPAEKLYADAVSAGGIVPGAGCSGVVSFRPPAPAPQLAASPAAAAAGGLAPGGRQPPGASGVSDFEDAELLEVLQAVRSFTVQTRLLGAPKAEGAAAALGRQARVCLLDLAVAWAGACPAVTLPPTRPVCEARVAVHSPPHDGLRRSVSMKVTGPELAAMRAAAAATGRGFLAGFSLAAGHPFAGVAEWEYFAAAPVAWLRFLADPPPDAASLSVKAPAVQQQQQQQQGGGQPGAAEAVAAVAASAPPDLDADGSPASSLPASRATSRLPDNGAAAGAAGGAEVRVDLGPDGLAPAVSAAMAALTAAGPGLATADSGQGAGGSKVPLVLPQAQGGSVELVLTPGQAAGLLGLLDDAASCVPSLLAGPPPAGAGGARSAAGAATYAAVVQPPDSAQRLLAMARGLAAATLRGGLLLGLAALPLFAMLRPWRETGGAALQAEPPAATSTTVGASAETSSAPAASTQPRQQQQQLSDDQLGAACGQVAALAGGMWVRVPDCIADPAALAASPAIEHAVFRGPALFQVVVSAPEQGASGQPAAGAPAGVRVLGVTPLNLAALYLHEQLPLTAELRAPGGRAAVRQAARLAERAPDALEARGAGKLPGDVTARYAGVPRAPLPPGGAAVLRLSLEPAVAAPEQAPPPPVDGGEASSAAGGAWRWVGKGKRRVQVAPLEVQVAAWSDADSLAAWHTGGASLAGRRY